MHQTEASFFSLPLCLLDEIDYPIALLHADGLLYCNAAAREQLAVDETLELRDGLLRARRPRDQSLLQAALRAAIERKARRLLAFDSADGPQAAALVPVELNGGSGTAALLVLGRRHVCESLSAWGFAHCCGLTPAEHAVLSQLCARRRPVEIARALGVALTTVRTHIANIRAKLGAPSIGEIVATLACLPPLRNAPPA